MSVCLDSWAIIAWLQGAQPAKDRVGSVIDARPVVSWVNLVEVYYRLERVHDRRSADETLERLKASLHPDLPSPARMVEAARLKAANAIALGDAFALATAVAHRFPLLTGDPEIIDLQDPPCQIEDLRGRPPVG